MNFGLALALVIAVLAPPTRPWAAAAAYLGMTINFVLVWRAHQRPSTDGAGP
jgi:hypothetical protein